ncbi:MAG: protein translocase subunit SecD [Gammaproteobacteria bacterium]|nr:protein translocase subunit SecD [Gammaproteobacteria bacterium]
MNRYPLWKYILIVIIMVFGVLYAAPNLYRDDPSVQVAANRNAAVTEDTLKSVENTLKDAGIAYKSAAILPTGMQVRFKDEQDQAKAKQLIAAALGNNYVVAISYAPTTPSWLLSLGAKPMYLGLDLRGGLHFLIEIDMKTAMRQQLDNYRDDIFEYFKNHRKLDIRARSMVVRGDTIELKYDNAKTRDDARDALRRAFQDMEFTDVERGQLYYLDAVLTKKKTEELRSNTISQIITVLKKRIDDKYQGLMEPVIVRQGDDRIVAEFPGVQNSDELMDVLTATASLEFRMEQDKYSVTDAMQGKAPGSKLYTMRDNGQPVLLKNKIIITGKNITYATATSTQDGLPAVNVTLDGVGAKIMGDNTKENLGKRMAVVFIEYTREDVMQDGKKVTVSKPHEEVISLATIQGVFSKQFQITGLTREESTKLALLLRAGALAAPIHIVEERTVGPSLGQENIEMGIKSVVYGMLFIIVFMIFWYRGFGLLANVALMANVVLIVAVLSLFQATLTLPGIAGIVLTVGMAVDANVLIYERIREELNLGNTPQASIHAGYEKAWATILDSNVTTLIAAMVLFILGTGPIKGFATTLSIGIATSMFTAILGTRAIVNLVVGGRRITKVSI